MKRRQFLYHALNTLCLFATPKLIMSQTTMHAEKQSTPITLFLCGDVMTGRGIDQIMPHPGDPRLYEPYVRNARRYVKLAEELNGPIPKHVDFAYIWGDALDVFELVDPDVRIINLETSVTTSDEYWPGKGIHYRMHPKNIPCLTAAGIDCCVLANNHVLDWGYQGLTETLGTLHAAKLNTAGAGNDQEQANAPAVMALAGKGRVVVFAFGMASSGVYNVMAATDNKPGVNVLSDFSDSTLQQIKEAVQAVKRAGDIVVVSIHWGGNWGYAIPDEHIDFAHRLVDVAGVDIIHGHSSHHVIGIDVYKDKPIFYGCGDLLTDYEGISGYEEYRDDLGLMYFVRMDTTSGKLVSLEMVPTQLQRFRLHRAVEYDRQWLQEVLNREGRQFNTRVETGKENNLLLHW